MDRREGPGDEDVPPGLGAGLAGELAGAPVEALEAIAGVLRVEPAAGRRVGVRRDHVGAGGHEVAVGGDDRLRRVEEGLGRPQAAGRLEAAGGELLAEAAVEQEAAAAGEDVELVRHGDSFGPASARSPRTTRTSQAEKAIETTPLPPIRPRRRPAKGA